MARWVYTVAWAVAMAWGQTTPAQVGSATRSAPATQPSSAAVKAPTFVYKPTNHDQSAMPGSTTASAPRVLPSSLVTPNGRVVAQNRETNPSMTPATTQAPVQHAFAQTRGQAVQPVVALSRPDPVPLHLARPIATTPGAQMADELRPFVRDLFEALRPSLRERAATALAEGRYGWRPEVKELLAKAAKTDPAPAVQVRCMQLLSQLGYHEPAYVAYLSNCLGSQVDEVRQAAHTSLTKLSLRAEGR